MYKRVVVKVGTKVLSKANGLIDEGVIAGLVTSIAEAVKGGTQVVLITSGAVGSGRGLLKSRAGRETVADKQVFAAVGQVKLMEAYSRLFSQHGLLCAQVLVTKEDFRDRGHYDNMRRCFLNLLRDDVIPIVNENDVVAIKELVFTDNDELAGLVASQLETDAVILLTSVDGVHGSSGVIPEIDIKSLAGFQKHVTSEKTDVGRGGMMTKFGIAKKLISSGIAVHIANGKAPNVIRDILAGKPIGTHFIPSRKTSGVKRRLAYAEGLAAGALVVNKCAADLLKDRDRVMSLLPVGITAATGEFKKGDVVEIQDQSRHRLGFGVSSLDREKVQEALGKKGGRPVVHYDYMFIE